MSIRDCHEPQCAIREGAIELVITSRPKDLGDFEVRRVLPASARQRVGPFIFFDHMGPATFAPGPLFAQLGQSLGSLSASMRHLAL